MQWEGERLDAMPNELFFSLHPDENHADCILRPCSVQLHADGTEPPSSLWGGLSRHSYLVWRAYEGKKVYSLAELPHKRFRDALAKELKRQPKQIAPPPPKPRPAPKVEYDRGPLANEELRGIWLPRKYLEVTSGDLVVGVGRQRFTGGEGGGVASAEWNAGMWMRRRACKVAFVGFQRCE